MGWRLSPLAEEQPDRMAVALKLESPEVASGDSQNGVPAVAVRRCSPPVYLAEHGGMIAAARQEEAGQAATLSDSMDVASGGAVAIPGDAPLNV